MLIRRRRNREKSQKELVSGAIPIGRISVQNMRRPLHNDGETRTGRKLIWVGMKR